MSFRLRLTPDLQYEHMWPEIDILRSNSIEYPRFQRGEFSFLSENSAVISLASTIEEVLERKSSDSCLEIDIKAVGDPPSWLSDTPLSAKIGKQLRRQAAVARSV
jgi:hypothetical protein